LEKGEKSTIALEAQLKKYAKEAKTPISGKVFLDNLYAKANVCGRNIGVEYAEGFTLDRTLGVNSLFDIV